MKRKMIKHNGKSERYRDDTAFIEWLEAQKKGYQKICRNSMMDYIEFLESEGLTFTPTQILQKHKQNRKQDDNKVRYWFDDTIVRFVEYLKQTRNLSHNSAIANASSLRGFFSFHREPLQIRKSDKGKVSFEETTKKYHCFRHHELVKMVSVAGLEEKSVLTLGTCEGIRVSDFVSQLRQPILDAFEDSKDSEGIPHFPIEWEILTEKEKTVAVAHITEDAWEILKAYWNTMEDSKYVFPSNGSHISTDRGNDVIKNTWNRAFPDRQDAKIRFHELRSYKMTILSNSGCNKWHIKRMVGKKVSPDILSYLKGIDLKKDFEMAYRKFRLTGVMTPKNHEAIEELQTSIVNQQTEILDLKKRLDIVTDKLTSIFDSPLYIKKVERADGKEEYYLLKTEKITDKKGIEDLKKRLKK